MEQVSYRERISDSVLQEKLEAMGAVLVEGPKWCGKTTSAAHAAASVVYLADTETQSHNIEMVNLNPHLLLDGPTPMLIDEWQEAPRLWDAIRHEVDKRGGVGYFILTGSAVPDEDKLSQIHHTGTGRIARMRMRPMSLFESGDSTGQVSLGALFEGHTDIAMRVPDDGLQAIAYLICRGGWPGVLSRRTERAALRIATEYLEAVVCSDVSRVDGAIKNPARVRRLMRSYARHQGAMAPLNTLSADISANEAEQLSPVTVSRYVEALKKIFVVEDSAAWNPNLRSRTAVRSSDTRYFIDPSIAAAALEVGPSDLMSDLNTMGLLFETMAVRDLRVYADALDGSVGHYRDKNGLECDAVVHLRGGRYGLVEIKLGGDTRIDEGASSLLKLSSLIDTDKMRAPSFLMVLTAVGSFAYRRADGVLVVPIRSLRN